MKIKNYLLPIFALTLTGCGKATPDCSDNVVQTTAIDVFRNAMIAQVLEPITQAKRMNGMSADMVLPGEAGIVAPIKQATLSLSGIRTTGSNKETGAKSCAAQVTINSGKTVNIEYKVEMADKGDKFYVTLLSSDM